MTRLLIAIDGACRKNGSPECVASGGVFIHDIFTDATTVLSNFERGSTNQRGELLALLTALDYICQSGLDANIITDSEYLFKAVTRQWCYSWHKKGWVTALDEPVKNKDIWLNIMQLLQRCEDNICMYHIKGHCIPFGKVTASRLLDSDPSGKELLTSAYKKYDAVRDIKQDKLVAAQDLSIKNNGFSLAEEALRTFVSMNVVADAIATCVVEKAYCPS